VSATRFHLVSAGASPITPAFDAGWEQNGQADRVRMVRDRLESTKVALANSTTITVPITTTQDILCRQFIGDSMPAVNMIGTFSLVVRAFESATTANVTLAVVVKLVGQDGGNQRVLFSTFNTDTEFAASGSDATRIVNAQTITSTVGQPGDRLVIEIGGHAAAPSGAGSYNLRFGNNAASDFALTSGLTTDLNPWAEFSFGIFDDMFNNFEFASAGDGMSVSERCR